MNTFENSVLLIGRVGASINLNTTKTGKSLLSFSLATEQRFKKPLENKKKKGDTEYEYIKEVSWHTIKLWGKLAELGNKYIEKGDLLLIKGSIKYNVWEDGDGKEHKSTDILALEFKILAKSNKKNDVVIELDENNIDGSALQSFVDHNENFELE